MALYNETEQLTNNIFISNIGKICELSFPKPIKKFRYMVNELYGWLVGYKD